MRKLILSLFIILLSASFCLAGQGMGPGPGCKGYAGACSASYGDEALTGGNATDLGGSEQNDLDGWTNVSCSTFESSIDYSTDGSYSLKALAGANGQYFSRAITGLTANAVYKLSWRVRYADVGTNTDWNMCFGKDTSTYTLRYSVPATDTPEWSSGYWLFKFSNFMDTLHVRENGPGNAGGVYIDSFSIKPATLCLGPELNTAENATSPTNEANATTGWTAHAALDSLVSSATAPDDGSYHLLATETGDADAGFYTDLSSAPFNLQNGDRIFISWSSRYTTGVWTCGTAAVNNPTSNWSSYVSAYSSYNYPGYAITYDANYRYFVCKENNAGNNGSMYLDKFSVKKILAE